MLRFANILLNVGACPYICSLLSILNRPLYLTSPGIMSGHDCLLVSNWFVKRKQFTFSAFALAEQRPKKKNVSEQWCHLNYAGMVDVYWEVKRCINKAWRYLRSAANRNIGPLSFCKLILLLLFFYLLIFKIFKGFQAVCKIAMVICKLEKIKEERNV